jgi:acetolactate synthase-1/2/3 large subunit
MNIQELQTLVNYGIKIKTFIVNNHIYGITKAYQITNFEGRFLACGSPYGYAPPDFRKVVPAYGIKLITIDNHEEMVAKIREALNYDGSVVVDVNCDEFRQYEPKIVGWSTPIEDMFPLLDRKEFRDNMSIEPLDGWDKTP